MARTKHGIFAQTIKDSKELQSEFNGFSKQFFNEDGLYNANLDFYSDFAYSAEAVYKQCENVKLELGGLLKTTNFEMDINEEKYKEMLKKTTLIEEEVVSKFNDVYNMISQNGITDVEQRTLDKMSIYRSRG